MNQFLQDFIQHPEEAERRKTHIIIITTTTCTAEARRAPYLPLMLKFFPSIRCLREGCRENAGMTASKSASKPATSTLTHHREAIFPHHQSKNLQGSHSGDRKPVRRKQKPRYVASVVPLSVGNPILLAKGKKALLLYPAKWFQAVKLHPARQ